MIQNILLELIKLLNGKNVAFVALLIITCMSAYLVQDFTTTLLQDNKRFIESINNVDSKLEDILRVLIEHEKHSAKKK